MARKNRQKVQILSDATIEALGAVSQNPGPIVALRVLGSFALTIEGRDIDLPRKAQALMALLALRGNEWQERDAVADMLWDDRSLAQVRQSLRQCLWIIRRECDCDLLEATRGSLRLPSDKIVVDALKLEASATTENLEDLGQCAKLYRGALLEGLPSISSPFDEWLSAERARFAELAAAVFTHEAEARATARDFDAAIAIARRLVLLDNLNERSHRLLISLLARAGRRLQALEQFEVCAATLQRELKVTPDPETVELARSISAGASGPNFNASILSDASVDTEPARIPRDGETEAVPYVRAAQPAIKPDDPFVAAEPPNISGFGGRQWRRVAAVLAAMCIVAVVVAVASGSRPVSLQKPPILLVVPFTNNSTIGEDWLAAGVSSLLTEELRETYSLRVSQYRPEASDAVPVREYIAATPTVRYVLDGTASFYSPLDITVHLTDRNGVTLWSNRYARAPGEVTDLVDDIATHVSRAVASNSKVFGPAPVDQPKQTSRELLALAAFERRDASEASLVAFQQILQRAAGLDPNNSETLALLSGSYLTHFSMTGEDSDLTEADRYLDSALALDQTNVGALWDKCFLRRMQGRYADALEWCRRVLDINPHQAGALREVGHNLVALHDPADAIPWFHAAIEAAPEHPWVDNAYFGISEAEIEMGHVDAAIAAAQEAVRHDHWGSFVGLYWAAALEIAGRDVEARSALAQFYKHHPEFPPSDSLVTRVFVGYSVRPPMLTDAFRRLGLNVADAEK